MRMSTNYKQQGTHMLTLMKAVAKTKGDVCELGAGFSSTPLLHWITLGRNLVTYESDPDYYRFATKFRTKNHKIRAAKRDFSNVDFKRHWSVVFIDHSPKRPQTRGDDAVRFENADLIVLHDTEPESSTHYGYDQVFKKFKYHYTWDLCKPHTSVVSNTIDVCALFQS